MTFRANPTERRFIPLKQYLYSNRGSSSLSGNKSIQLTAQALFKGIVAIQLMTRAASKSIDLNQLMTQAVTQCDVFIIFEPIRFESTRDSTLSPTHCLLHRYSVQSRANILTWIRVGTGA